MVSLNHWALFLYDPPTDIYFTEPKVGCIQSPVTAITRSATSWSKAWLQSLHPVERQKQEDQSFKVILGYLVSSRPTWDIGDPVLKKQTQKERKKLHTDTVSTPCPPPNFFLDKVSLWSLDCPGTHSRDQVVSNSEICLTASPVLGFKAWATTPDLFLRAISSKSVGSSNKWTTFSWGRLFLINQV